MSTSGYLYGLATHLLPLNKPWDATIKLLGDLIAPCPTSPYKRVANKLFVIQL